MARFAIQIGTNQWTRADGQVTPPAGHVFHDGDEPEETWVWDGTIPPSGNVRAPTVAEQLAGLKTVARQAIKSEGVNRMSATNSAIIDLDAYDLFDSVFTTLIAIGVVTGGQVVSNLTEPLATLRSIFVAGRDMVTEVNTLTTLVDVQAYIDGIAADVAVAPRTVNWP